MLRLGFAQALPAHCHTVNSPEALRHPLAAKAFTKITENSILLLYVLYSTNISSHYPMCSLPFSLNSSLNFIPFILFPICYSFFTIPFLLSIFPPSFLFSIKVYNYLDRIEISFLHRGKALLELWVTISHP